ncbi:threonine dehydratase [Polycladomyces abyssicola]|uniref:threonine ammonia-lyase n=1 Tax=Polycladomyces abyssicola TaxID=1125966 RepID=A0A8D5UF25_9BACL|nr:threonine dehydratase [Polycladomyces abyssicola]
MEISVHDIFRARHHIEHFVDRTPLAPSVPLSNLIGAQVRFKLENYQRTGSFKPRGAINKMRMLSEEERKRGVIAASAGNHGLAVAYAAGLVGTSAQVVVPERTPKTKVAGIQRLGAELVFHGTNYDEAEEYAYRLAAENGRSFIHAYEDQHTIAGHGTIGLEILLDWPEADVIVVPAGGGGLILGIAILAKSVRPDIRIIGVQSHASPPWYYSFRAGRMVEVTYRESLAEGLHGGIGQKIFPLVLHYVDDFVLVGEEEIAEAMCWMARQHHQRVEGSGAVGVAALRNGRIPDIAGKNVVCLISGGNVDDERLLGLLEAQERVEKTADRGLSITPPS